MEKLISGIRQFQKTMNQDQRDQFAQLAQGQKPEVLFITCADSRLVPHQMTSTNPGDLFVVRNVGNMIPPADTDGLSKNDTSEPAAIEFAIESLGIKNIVVCGHSECGAMKGLLNDNNRHSQRHLCKWLENGVPSKDSFKDHRNPLAKDLSDVNALSQSNVLQQIENLKTYPLVEDHIKEGKLQLHAWWFEISTAHVYFYNDKKEIFEIVD